MSVIDHAEFIKRLKGDDYELNVFYDIGASIGKWTQQVEAIYPNSRFELFEPLLGKNKDLDDNLLYDRLKADIGVHPIALSDTTGTNKIKMLDNRGVGSSILIMDADYRKDITMVEVPMYTMDEYVQQNGVSYPDFIKLDTQASELKILSGGIECLKHASFCLIETWMRRVYGPETPLFQELAIFMESNGYTLFEIMIPEEGRDADGTLRWFDSVFVNKNVYPAPAGWY